MPKMLPPTVLLIVLLAACGGDDSDTDVAASTTPTAPVEQPTSTEPLVPPSDGTEPLDDPEFVNLLAWCLGWHEGATIDLEGASAEADALDELFVQTDAVVPAAIADAWDAYTSAPGPEDSGYRLAYREIDQFWLDNCADHVTIGTEITQP